MDPQSQIETMVKIAQEVLAEFPEHSGTIKIESTEPSKVIISGLLPYRAGIEILIRLTQRVKESGLPGLVAIDVDNLLR